MSLPSWRMSYARHSLIQTHPVERIPQSSISTMTRPRTSKAFPLRIDSISPHPDMGRIGMTFCPGKKQAHPKFGGAWNRDLDLDLLAIRAAGYSLVISLMESHEFSELQVEDLGRRAESTGLAWIGLPIVDGHAPDRRFDYLWLRHGRRIRRLLREGTDICIHCKGGLGRTGLLAAKLMVELGTNPEAAILNVREARPGAIETPEQEAYVRAQRFLDESRDETLSRIAGSLIAGAVGDAWGNPVEFMRLSDIRSRYGPEGLREPLPDKLGRLLVTDDTQMSLFTIEGLARAIGGKAPVSRDVILESLRKAYCDWHVTQSASPSTESIHGHLARHTVLHHRRAPGNTCLGALAKGGRGSVSAPINDSKGAGTVMRTGPIGFFVTRLDQESAFVLGRDSSALTHGHPSGYLAGAAMAWLIWNAIRAPHPSARPFGALIRRLMQEPGHRETVELLVRSVDALALHMENVAGGELGQGWVAEEALAIALFASHNADLGTALSIAVNHDGDSDTTGSICGQLWGAKYGLDNIPSRWMDALDAWEPIIEMIDCIPLDAIERGDESSAATGTDEEEDQDTNWRRTLLREHGFPRHPSLAPRVTHDAKYWAALAKDLPPDSNRYEDLIEYATAFNGYQYAEEVWLTSSWNEALEEILAGTLPESVPDLRACLFLIQRIIRHADAPGTLEKYEPEFFRLISAIRERLAETGGGDERRSSVEH